MNGAIYTPDSCCYAWTNYYTIANIGGREITLKNNYTYCGPYEKSKIEETIKTIKESYKNDDEIVGFDMFIDCGDKQEKEEEKKEEEKEEDKEEDKEDEKEEGKEEVKEEEEKDNHDSNEDNSNKGDFNNNSYIILNICLLLILIF